MKTVISAMLLMAMGLAANLSPPSVILQRSQMLMGTVVTVTAVAPDKELARRATAAGLKEVRRLEELWSTWIPTSELSRVNDAAGQHPVKVSPETLALLERSMEMERLTEGGFNVAIGPAVDAWNVSREGRVPSLEELEALRPLLALSQVRLDKESGTVFLERAGMQIDVGGIGKGYAADLAVNVMQREGATAGVVALSGDIKTFGTLPNDQRFVFGIQHPRKEQGQVLARIALENEAVSTAGDYQRFFMQDGIRYHHILDPRTLQPARLAQSVTVIAKEGVMADGLDTGIFVMGPEKGLALIERLPDVEGVIIDAEGQVRVSSGLRNRLQMERP